MPSAVAPYNMDELVMESIRNDREVIIQRQSMNLDKTLQRARTSAGPALHYIIFPVSGKAKFCHWNKPQYWLPVQGIGAQKLCRYFHVGIITECPHTQRVDTHRPAGFHPWELDPWRAWPQLLHQAPGSACESGTSAHLAVPNWVKMPQGVNMVALREQEYS